MMWLLGFAAGYVLGARADKEEFDDVVQALRASATPRRSATSSSSCGVTPGRPCADFADLVERRTDSPTAGDSTVVLGADLVDRVRRMIGDP